MNGLLVLLLTAISRFPCVQQALDRHPDHTDHREHNHGEGRCSQQAPTRWRPDWIKMTALIAATTMSHQDTAASLLA